ncbi:hypothetical protein HKD37_12G033910 [Glycine soja]
MDEDQWMYEGIVHEEVDMDYENEEECGVNEPHVDCSDAFNTSQDVLRWARSVAYENGFVAVIVRSDTNTGNGGRTSFVLIGCERSGEYRCRKKEFVRRDIETRKCGCPFKLCGKSVVGGQGWTAKLIYEIHNHELVKSLVGHPFAGRLSKAEKTLITDMTKSMVKPKNILLTLKDDGYPFMHEFIDNIVDVRADGNCGYQAVAGLLGMGEESWSLIRTHLLIELAKFTKDYIKLFGGTDQFEDLRMPLHVDGLTTVTMDKWMDITDMGYVIASRYNVILVSLSHQQSMMFFSLRSQPSGDPSVHRIICIGHVYGNHFVQTYLKDRCPLPLIALLWSTNCHTQAKQWSTSYISRMQHYRSFTLYKRDYVDLNDD